MSEKMSLALSSCMVIQAVKSVVLVCPLVQDMRRDLGISHFEGKMEVKDMEVNTLDRK